MEKTLELLNLKFQEAYFLKSLFEKRTEMNNRINEIESSIAADEDKNKKWKAYRDLCWKKEVGCDYSLKRYNELMDFFKNEESEINALQNELNSTKPAVLSFLEDFKDELTKTFLKEINNYQNDKEKFIQNFELLLKDFNNEEMLFEILNEISFQLSDDFLYDFAVFICSFDRLNEFFGASDIIFDRLESIAEERYSH